MALRFLLRLPLVRALYQRQLLFPAVVILLAIIVLVMGALEQSDVQPASSAVSVSDPVPVEVSRPVGRADLEKTPLTYFSDYWVQLAERTAPFFRRVGSDQTPALIIGPKRLLTTIEPALEVISSRRRAELLGELPLLDEVTGLAPSLSDSYSYQLNNWNRDLGLAIFDIVESDQLPFTLSDPGAMSPGSYVAGVSLSPDGDTMITPGFLVQSGGEGAGGLAVSMDFSDDQLITAIVDLDGALLGVSYLNSSGRRIISSTEMLVLFDESQERVVCRSIEVTDLDPSVKEFLVLEEGVLIEYVHEEAFVEAPDLSGGDVLLEWGGERITSAVQFRGLYDLQESGVVVPFRILRNRRRSNGEILIPDLQCDPTDSAPVRLDQFGFVVQWRPKISEDSVEEGVVSGWQVVAVGSGSAAARAGIEEGDWIVSVRGIVVSSLEDGEAVRRTVGETEPFMISLRSGSRSKLVVLHPQIEDEVSQNN